MKRTEKDTEIAIFAYPSSLSSEAKTYIRNFIFATLQKEMDRSINGMSEDKTDYNLEAQSFQLLKDAYAAGVKMEEKKEKEEEAEDKPEGEGEEKEEAAEEPGKDASEEKAGGEEPSGESA